MPAIRWFQRRSSPVRLLIELLFVVLIVGGQTLAVIGLLVAERASDHAAHVAGCVNKVTGSRNRPSLLDTRAHIAFLRALRTFEEEVFGQPAPSPAQYHAAQATLVKATEIAVRQLQADQDVRDRHPFGRCP